MQFIKAHKEAIAQGEINTSFRVWKSPRAKVGGQYNIYPFGAIEVTQVERVRLQQVAEKDIKRSGFDSRAELISYLKIKPSTEVFQINFHFLGEQAVKQPSQTRLKKSEIADLHIKLKRMDRQTPWTHATLGLIHAHPGTRAGDLAPLVDMDLPSFKRNVRKLKALGLTESLETGYRLSERGEQVHRSAQSDHG